MAAESSIPLGERVAQITVRSGIPPLDIIPGFQEKFLSDGITGWEWTSPSATPSIKIPNAHLVFFMPLVNEFSPLFHFAAGYLVMLLSRASPPGDRFGPRTQ